MKVVILAGGLGTRLHEYTKTIPKPMVRIGGYPILIHIINIYLRQGFNDFYIAAGYKKEIIKKYFNNYKNNGIPFETKIFKKKCKITIVDTGRKTLTGGRLKKIKNYLPDCENFMFTYGDGVSDVNIRKLLKFHIERKKIITVTAVRPPARFGEIILNKKNVVGFEEKPQVTKGWINGGFFVAKKEFLNLIKSDKTILEKEPLEYMVKTRNLSAYTHDGFWKCMDTKRDKDELEEIYRKKKFF